MPSFSRWLSRHKNLAHLIVFALIALPPVGLYFSASSRTWSLALLAVIVLGNLLAVLIP